MSGLSIIIPTLNEAERICALLESLPLGQENVEVIVVDGGSVDDTWGKLASFSVKALSCSAGRGQQLAKGLERARHEIVWLLHADSRVSAKHVDAILQFMKDVRYVGGNFAIEFDGKDDFSHWLNRFYRAMRKRGFYYGDSGIFLRREALLALGGIPPRRLMEDYALVRKMESCGERTLCIEYPKIVSSSRRFKGRSRSNIIFGWIIIHVLYYFRVPDACLAKIYNASLFSAKP